MSGEKKKQVNQQAIKMPKSSNCLRKIEKVKHRYGSIQENKD